MQKLWQIFMPSLQGRIIDLLKVNVDGSVESYVLPLRAYRRKFPGNLISDGLSKPNTT